MAAAVHQPPEHVVKGAHVDSLAKYKDMYARSLSDPEGFWGEFASQFHWNKKWSTGADFHKYNFDLNKGGISLSWFNGAETNVCYNCVDRHVKEGNGDRVAFFWEGNDVGQATTTTYKELQDMVCQIANYMKSQGVGKGDDVTIYMPMVPELPAVMLACARIGAVFSVVFAGFSAESLAGRISDSSPKMVVTCSAVKRGPKHIELKKIVDEALQILDNEEELHIPRVLVYDHKASGVSRDAIQASPVEGRDVWWQDVIGDQSTDCEVTWVGAEDPLFKLYTSGSTGKPKGVLHTTAGYMIGAAATFNYVFDYKPDDIFWCTADCGWITGHSYVTFGPLLMGAKQVLFEGVPTYPDAGRCWEVCDKYGVTLFYTAPTAIRTLMACGEQHVTKHKRTSLRILGTVGEPINPEAWRWYYEVVGNSNVSVVDTWWQTETGAHMITPLPGATPMKPGSATLPFFGVEPAILDDKGNEVEGPGQGYLVIKRPWPSMMRTVAGDHPRFEQTYFSHYKGYYFTGDGARRDEDGYYWILGRVDDVINVSGHRIGTAEVESALVGHHLCAEAAVVPVDHPIKGQAIYAFVTLMNGIEYPPDESVRKELVAQVRKAIGPIATPDVIHWAPGLPKTRSGKIMRRVLRKIASKEEDQLGDTSTLADPGVVQVLLELRGK
ncbi:acetyl-coenzyme A chloroplastic glyoxysomal-like [Chlorella sorokiniana]|uniref:Acetyl-coenzyme A synthetase n=1 Tax=Chlorella sorokiniana TaxID=3076 RepID=A0A2P6U0R3_CHLSO|nr:acetyl-coenzyme A chloroplastic glyoxysomal-like [Chlorella sorokiniana]|eukprot:PRW59907.1 acetyl-coenzyme A chloroplastic glyoxysomal-like [Chlorella sorokiniana]